MRVYTLLSFATFAAASSDAALLDERATALCGVPGSRKALPFSISVKPADRTPTACSALCKKTRGCQSFALSKSVCWLFLRNAGTDFTYDAKSVFKFWDISCSISTATSGVITPTATPTDTNGDGIPDPFTIPTAGPVAGDSSPVTDAVDPAALPTDDPDFTNTYTYTEYDLPSVAAMGSAPNTAGLSVPTDAPQPPCMLDPSKNTDQFNVLGSNFVPLVSAANNNLAPLASPTSEAQASAFGPADKYPVPSFYFEKPAAAPSGIYDLVLAGTPPKYVAKLDNGNVLLTTSSTGAQRVRRNGQFMQTSVFQVNCQGRFNVTQGGAVYTWDINGRTTKMTAGNASKGMVAYPLSLKARTRKIRRSKYNSGVMPRCPKEPEALVAKVRPDARPAQSNGCGPANGVDFVPDFTFGSCCDKHDLCFDDCPGGTFEQCNSDFHSCMISDGCSSKNHWYMWLIYGACLKAADFYYFAVSTPVGAKAFISAGQERCTCTCPGQQSLCGSNPSDCRSLYSNDVNNCGGCGRTCGTGSVCKNGNCDCPIDRCGTKCLSLRNNPNNCGSCGNVCSTGYCQQGQCYTPPAKCEASFPNGDFTQSRNLNEWTFNKWQDTVSEGKYSGRPSVALEEGRYSSTGNVQEMFVIVPKDQGSKFLEFSSEVTMCPGKKYNFDFSIFHDEGFQGSGACTFSMRFADQNVFGPATFDGKSNSLSTQLYASQHYPGGVRQAGPFTKDTPGVEKNGLSLTVPSTGRVDCGGGAAYLTYAKMRFGNFKISEA